MQKQIKSNNLIAILKEKEYNGIKFYSIRLISCGMKILNVGSDKRSYLLGKFTSLSLDYMNELLLIINSCCTEFDKHKNA